MSDVVFRLNCLCVTSDLSFLPSYSDPLLAASSRFQEGRDASNVPSTPEAMAEAYRNSDVRRRMVQELEDYKRELAGDKSIEQEFREANIQSKGKGVSKKSVYTVS